MKNPVRTAIVSATIALGSIGGVALVSGPVFAANPVHHATSPTASGSQSGSGTKGTMTPAQRLQKVEGLLTNVANKELSFVTKGTGIEGKIQAILTKAQQKGVDVSSAQQTFSDFETQLTSAQTSAQSALSTVQSITATTLKDAKSSLEQARSDVKSARTDLQAARKDLQALRADWKAARESTTPTGGSPATGSSSSSQAPGTTPSNA